MPRPRTAVAFVSSIFIAALIAGAAAGAARPWQPIVLKSVAVGSSNIIPAADGRGAVAIPLKSSSADLMWVAVRLRPPAPATVGSVHIALEAHRDTVIRFPQDAFAEGDYVISVAVFADSSSRDTLESGSTNSRFAKKDVKALGDWLRASTLPKTFKHVEKVDRVSAGTTLSSMFGAPKGDGTLTVESSGVTYSTKKASIVIPASALREIGLNDSSPRQPWVVVIYEEAGEKKIVSFKPNVYKGEGAALEIAAAIQAAMRSTNGK